MKFRLNKIFDLNSTRNRVSTVRLTAEEELLLQALMKETGLSRSKILREGLETTWILESLKKILMNSKNEPESMRLDYVDFFLMKDGHKQLYNKIINLYKNQK
jgi:hypothetical protein